MKRVVVASLAVLCGTYGLRANAQEVAQPSYFERQMAAPAGAFEVGVSGMWNQGWGNLTDDVSAIAPITGRKVSDISNAGVGVELDLGYRAMPSVVFGIFGTATEYSTQEIVLRTTDIRSVTAGIQGQYFFRPYKVVNPWVGLASAWRGYWVVPDVGGITSRQGWELARVQLGVDLRASREISVGPFISGAMDIFFTEKFPRLDSRNLDGTPVAWFFSAGILGRFDVAGSYHMKGESVASR